MEWKWLHCSAVQNFLLNIFNLCFTVTLFFPLLFHLLSCFYSLPPSPFAKLPFTLICHYDINIQSGTVFDVWVKTLLLLNVLKELLHFLSQLEGTEYYKRFFVTKWINDYLKTAMKILSRIVSHSGTFGNLKWKFWFLSLTKIWI